MTPTESELLPEPIQLKECPSLTVREWRPTKGYEKSTGPSLRTIMTLNFYCRKATEKFPKFLKENKLKFSTQNGKFKISMSLLPFKKGREGFNYRNLNDLTYRFKNRYSEYDSEGNPYPIFGYTSYTHNYIFIRNDVLTDNGETNPKFVQTFVHELFHAMSYHFRVYHNHKGDIHAADEAYAVKFEEYLGFKD